MSYVLRPGGLADLPSVREISYATWPTTFKDILTPEQITYMLEWLYAPDRLARQVETGEHVFTIAEENGQAIGFCAHQLDHPEAGNTKIHKLYLRLETQGRGIGRALVDNVCAIAKAAGHRSVTLNVNKFNRAVQFYEAIGFIKARAEVIDIGNGYVMDDYVMLRTL